MLERCITSDLNEIYVIINDAASAYKGIIPDDCWHEPYMSFQELEIQISQGVEFWCYKDNTAILGVMGVQDRGDVTLIRHAYVRSASKGKGIGSKLLSQLTSLTDKPILIGTWAAATWAIGFYAKHGFQKVSEQEKNRLLMKYWTIPQRQVETSVVLSRPGGVDNIE